MYELITNGNSPFPLILEEEGSTASILVHQNEYYYWSIRHNQIKPFSAKNYQEIPDKLDKLILKCLEKDPNKRPHNFFYIEYELLEIYKELTKKDYPREYEIPSELMAMELNNRAISLLEIGYSKKGKELLEKALKIAPNLIEIQLNNILLNFLENNISLKEFYNKILNYFDNTERDIEIINILLSLSLKYGCFIPFILSKILKLEKKYLRDIKLQRLKAKVYYLKENYIKSLEIFKKLCVLSSSRLEDWYHLIGCFYHLDRRKDIKEWFNQIPLKLRVYPVFKEIKKLLNFPYIYPAEPPEDTWYEIERIDFKIDNDFIIKDIIPESEKYFIIYFRDKNSNFCKVYNINEKLLKTYSLPFHENITPEQIFSLKNDDIGILTLEGKIYIQNISNQKLMILTLPLNLENSNIIEGKLYFQNNILISLYICEDNKSNKFSRIFIFSLNNREYKLIYYNSLSFVIKFLSIDSLKKCWFSDGEKLLQINPFEKNDKLIFQKYGYKKDYSDFQEISKIIGLYTLKNSIVILKEVKKYKKSKIIDSLLYIYIWDIKSNEHKSNIISNFILYAHDIAINKDILVLIGKKIESKNNILIKFNLYECKEEILKEIPYYYKNIKILNNESFIFITRIKDLSILDNLLEDKNIKDNLIYTLNKLEISDRFDFIIEDIMSINSCKKNRLIFFISHSSQIYIWKSILQDPFKLSHRLSYIYLKPRSTFQELNLQKRIQLLLDESDKALKKRDYQRALDYLRGIQNFKGYDWNLIMNKIYNIALEHNWYKIGIREILKKERIDKKYEKVVLNKSNKVLYQFQPKEEDKFPYIVNITNLNFLKKVDINKNGKWIVSFDGRFIIQQKENNEITIYNIPSFNELFKINLPIRIEEFIVNLTGEIYILKEEGFGKVILLDIKKNKIEEDIFKSRYHTLQDTTFFNSLGNKLIFANECEGGFQWEIIKKENNQWISRIIKIDFNSSVCEEGDEKPIFFVFKENFIFFRGLNFDFLNDIQFKHIQLLNIQKEEIINIENQEFRSSLFKTTSIINFTKNGKDFILLAQNNKIECWNISNDLNKINYIFSINTKLINISTLTLTQDINFIIIGSLEKGIEIYKIDIEKKSWERVEKIKIDEIIKEITLLDNDRYLIIIGEKYIYFWEIDWIWNVEKYIE